MIALVAALLSSAAILLIGVRPKVGIGGQNERGVGPSEPIRPPTVQRLRPLIAVLGFLAGWGFVGGPKGMLAGLFGAMLLWWVASRIEDPRQVRRRERLQADLPVAVDLLAACLAAGSSLESALPKVSEAVGGSAAEELALIEQRIALGLSPERVWHEEGAPTALAPFCRAMLRSHESGVPVRMVLQRLSKDLRDQQVADLEARAKSVEVRAAAPLGLCLLPAFVVLGIVPMVAGLFSAMSILR